MAAVAELLEQHGVDGISTRTVGEALGAHPTALYRHFRDMDELLREAADHILAGLETVAIDEPDDWLAIRQVCAGLRAKLMAHPGAARVMAPGPSRKPNERALTERLLRILHAAGFSDAEAALAYHALIEFVVGSAAIDNAAGSDGLTQEDRHEHWREDYLSASSADFPHTKRIALALYPSQEEQFEFGLDLLLDGLRRRAGA